MKRFLWISTILLTQIFYINSTAANDTDTLKPIQSEGYFGIGLGLDYGGLGLRFAYLPVKHIEVFFGAGYNFNKIALNAGFSWKILPDKNIIPVLVAMYGYHTVFPNESYYDIRGNKILVPGETIYGFTAGGGADFKVGKRKKNKVSAILFYPFRDELTRKDAVLPVTFSLGFGWGL